MWAQWHLYVCERKDSAFKQLRLGSESGHDRATIAGCEGAIGRCGMALDGCGGQTRRGDQVLRDRGQECGQEEKAEEEETKEDMEQKDFLRNLKLSEPIPTRMGAVAGRARLGWEEGEQEEEGVEPKKSLESIKSTVSYDADLLHFDSSPLYVCKHTTNSCTQTHVLEK